MLTQEKLRSILSYDPLTGEFRWLVKYSKKVMVGALAGGLNAAGYVVIGIDGELYYAHRLAWFYVTGEWVPQIDHRDGDKSRNVWANLREATHQQNVLNAKKASNNTSGFKGVSWHKAAGKWSAYIILNGKKKHLGLHASAEDAHAAYMRAAQAVQPEFARAS